MYSIKNIICVAGIILIPATLISQWYSRIYIEEDQKRSTIWKVFDNNGDILCSKESFCSNGNLCVNYYVTDADGTPKYSREILYYKSFWNRMQVRNDTVFIAGNEFNSQDSFMYWKLTLLKTDGRFIDEFKFKTIHFSHFVEGTFGYIYPNLYGLTLVKNNEVILWGEGLDNRLSNADKVPYKSLFMRIGLEGSQKSDLFWFELNDRSTRRMADACQDIDGNMVFNYEYSDEEIPSIARAIYKIMPDDSILLVAKLTTSGALSSLPKITIDKEGNYYINPTKFEGNAEGYNVSTHHVGYISKINRNGDEVWRSMVPPINWDWHQQTVANRTNEIRRISTTGNGDILCTGRVFVMDSFPVPGQTPRMYSAGDGSFIARFNTEGELLWRHFVIPRKKNGHIRRNYIYDIQETSDGSIITGGEIERDDDKTDPRFTTDAWLMRLSPNGCLTDDCSHIAKYFNFPDTTSSTDDRIPAESLTLYPNPGTSHLSWRSLASMTYPVRYTLTNLQGIQTETGYIPATDAAQIYTDYLPAGMYILNLVDKSGRRYIGKWVKG